MTNLVLKENVLDNAPKARMLDTPKKINALDAWNLKKMDVCELTEKEMQEVEGGILPFLAGLAIGGLAMYAYQEWVHHHK